MQESNLELVFDVVEKTMTILYEAKHRKYFDLYFETINNILSCELTEEYDDLTNQKLLRLYKKLDDKDFTPEDIRKALQAIIIRGFKESNMPQDVTPDTLGYLIAYLITRLNDESKNISILDPLCGSGNLLLSIDNHINLDCELYAIDNDRLKIDLCKSMADLMNTNVNLYYQDTFSTKLKNMNFVVCDIPNKEDDFSYQVIRHHLDSLKLNGYLLAIVDSNLFLNDKDELFTKNILKDNSIYGIIELPDDFFITGKKSIVIFKHAVREEKNCLMVKLPSFNDMDSFNQTINQIEAWFERNKN